VTPAAHHQMFGHYNAWANGRLYEAVAQLSTEQYRADRGAFFKSVHGSLNHLLVTDRVWMQRFTGEADAPNRLDAILFETFAERRARRRTGGSSILWTGSMTGASRERSNTAGSLRPSNSSSSWPRRRRTGSITKPITAARSMPCLTGLVGKAPELDLLIFQRLSAKPAA
jgi:uncharacterized damage-inducible protein DinB